MAALGICGLLGWPLRGGKHQRWEYLMELFPLMGLRQVYTHLRAQ